MNLLSFISTQRAKIILFRNTTSAPYIKVQMKAVIVYIT